MTEQETSKKDLTKELLQRGLGHVFDRYYHIERHGGIEDLRKCLLAYPEILADNYEVVFGGSDSRRLNELFEAAKRFEADLYSMPFWRDKLNSISKTISEYSREVWLGHGDHILSAANMVPNFDWRPIFDSLAVHQNSNNYLRPSYRTVAKNFSDTKASEFKDYVEDNIFFTKESRPSYVVRGHMYSLYIENGFLTKKTARKIRSDGSEDSSLTGLKALTDNIELYSNSDELLLQFTDSKYEQVICHLANTLPEHLIASIMGTEFYWGKRQIENRLEKIEQ